MLRFTYIVFIFNNENNIADLTDSLKKIQGNFHKEFIFIDDGSSDDSLNMLKNYVKNLPRTTIITQATSGPTASLNKAFNLSTGDYIHFVEGDEIIHPHATSALIDACSKFGTDVAIGLSSSEKGISQSLNDVITLVQSPIDEILDNKIMEVRNVGISASLVNHRLIDQIDRADTSIYTANMSLSLRCAKHSKFALVKDVISTHQRCSANMDSRFVAYNNIKSIYNFVSANPAIFTKSGAKLLNNLSNEVLNKRSKVRYNLMSLSSKYFKSTPLDKILKLYEEEYNCLF